LQQRLLRVKMVLGDQLDDCISHQRVERSTQPRCCKHVERVLARAKEDEVRDWRKTVDERSQGQNCQFKSSLLIFQFLDNQSLCLSLVHMLIN
jgi:hypothetical protein